MSHEYDDPLSPEAIEQAAQLAHKFWREAPGGIQDAHITQAVDATICACATDIEDGIEGQKSGMHREIEEAVKARTLELNEQAGAWDGVDEASFLSFPASDPPAWITEEPKQE